MSRSRTKHPVTGWTTARSEKDWKRQMNRRRRAAEKQALRSGEPILPDPTRGLWGPKDGKFWHDEPAYCRK